jgi:hypothetical protein
MIQRVKKFIQDYRFGLSEFADGIGLGRHRLYSRLKGITAWTAPEIIRFHDYLEKEGVTVDLEELTRMCAADHGSE